MLLFYLILILKDAQHPKPLGTRENDWTRLALTGKQSRSALCGLGACLPSGPQALNLPQAWAESRRHWQQVRGAGAPSRDLSKQDSSEPLYCRSCALRDPAEAENSVSETSSPGEAQEHHSAARTTQLLQCGRKGQLWFTFKNTSYKKAEKRNNQSRKLEMGGLCVART